MIPIGNIQLYADALDCLQRHKQNFGRDFKGRFVQIFLGLKFFQNSIPSMFSGSFISTELLQGLLDDLYSKTSLPANDCVLALFEKSYLARTGLINPRNKSPQNTWRNNLNLQKGVGCYAQPADLSSLTFLNQNRVHCRHIVPATPGLLMGAKCSLCTGASYRNENHRKWLRIDPGGAGYAAVDLQNIPNFTPYVSPNGTRIPLAPLIVALYHNADPGLVLGTRTVVSVNEFAVDFNFSQVEVNAYFDLSPANALNQKLASSAGWPAGASVGTFALGSATPAAAPVSGTPVTGGMMPVLGGTPAPPPLINNGWDAEQYVAAVLGTAGWSAHVVSRQQLGYDIFVQRGAQRRYIEVKSSLGSCSPSLTAREWQQANYHGNSYVLAVIENFSATGLNAVHWVPNPAARCTSTPSTSISHSIARSSWSAATVPISSL